jgi:hypothetical protein
LNPQRFIEKCYRKWEKFSVLFYLSHPMKCHSKRDRLFHHFQDHLDGFGPQYIFNQSFRLCSSASHLCSHRKFYFFFAGNFCGLPGKYLNLPVGLWQKVGKSNLKRLDPHPHHKLLIHQCITLCIYESAIFVQWRTSYLCSVIVTNILSKHRKISANLLISLARWHQSAGK